MNFLLSLNKKKFLFFLFIIFILILLLFSFTYYDSTKNIKQVINNSNSNSNNNNNKKADITKPKFAISSDKQRISITAKEGFFLTNDRIMLEKNVIFKSSRFKILSDNVIFNKKNLVASSDHSSKFFSDNASIDSVGFDIIENGNIINFKGKTKLILK